MVLYIESGQPTTLSFWPKALNERALGQINISRVSRDSVLVCATSPSKLNSAKLSRRHRSRRLGDDDWTQPLHTMYVTPNVSRVIEANPWSCTKTAPRPLGYPRRATVCYSRVRGYFCVKLRRMCRGVEIRRSAIKSVVSSIHLQHAYSIKPERFAIYYCRTCMVATQKVSLHFTLCFHSAECSNN